MSTGILGNCEVPLYMYYFSHTKLKVGEISTYSIGATIVVNVYYFIANISSRSAALMLRNKTDDICAHIHIAGKI